MIGTLLSEMLTELGFQVYGPAATEDDAVAYASEYKPNLMLVDIQLREGDGLSAVDRIRRSGPMPCVFMSGAAEDIQRPRTAVLHKPFAERDLLRALQQVAGTTTVMPIGTPEIVAISSSAVYRPMGSDVRVIAISPSPSCYA